MTKEIEILVQDSPSPSKKAKYKHVPHCQREPPVVQRRNARERRRVETVNSAYLHLRRHIPCQTRTKRLSKMKTLRNAIDYINHLKNMLQECDAYFNAAPSGSYHSACSSIGVPSPLSSRHNDPFPTSPDTPTSFLSAPEESPTTPPNFLPSDAGSFVSDLSRSPDLATAQIIHPLSAFYPHTTPSSSSITGWGRHFDSPMTSPVSSGQSYIAATGERVSDPQQYPRHSHPWRHFNQGAAASPTSQFITASKCAAEISSSRETSSSNQSQAIVLPSRQQQINAFVTQKNYGHSYWNTNS